MKVLLVHEYYRSSSPSGEDRVFEKEQELLKSRSVQVKVLKYENDWIGTKNGPSLFETALFTPWSPIGRKLVEHAIREFKPDVVHFHNTFPVISQSALFEAKKYGAAVVQTFHNFRAICAQAMLMRENSVCEKCLMKMFPWPSLLHSCYRKSFFATVPLAVNITLGRVLKTWNRVVDRFIVLSIFNREKFIEAGFPKNKIAVKPNFFEDTLAGVEPPSKIKNSCVFIGRLKEEKGVQFLPEVWQKMGQEAPVLHVLGDGPLKAIVHKKIQSFKLNQKMILHGRCSYNQVNEILGRASLLVFPSIWYEGFPLVIGEAYAAGVPVAASRIGTPAFIVRDGVTGIHFRPGDIDDMANKLKYLMNNPDLLKAMAVNARQEYENKYTADANFEILMEIYREAIFENRRSQFSRV